MSGEEWAPGLYVVATPIGRPDDLSPRARACLAAVDVIAAEDTRVARTLLRAVDVRNRVVSFHDHNEPARVPGLVERIRGGGRVALISDQGTPLVADPGYRLVRACLEAGVRVSVLPGPSAVLAALVVSGLPPDRFTVQGFLPRRGPRRRAALEELRRARETQLFFEAPHRLAETLADLHAVLGDRPAALAKNLTKKDESVERGTLGALARAVDAGGKRYGEYTIAVGGAADGSEAFPPEALALIERLRREGLSARTIRDVVADVFGLPRAAVYERVLGAEEDAPG